MTTNPPVRTFDARPAVREATPVLVGLVGPSSSGKTYSALRLALGMQRITGGDIYGVDSEARRMLHYADKFKFTHVPFGAPFSPLDYLQVIEYCVKRGAKTIIVDSTSHEHEGPGGVLEMHEAEVARLSKGDEKKANAVKMLAWSKPKAARRRLINAILQMPCNFIFCFRAKPKLKIVPGGEPLPRGYQPISGDEWIYEMTLKCLLLPGANGFPSWNPEHDDEKAMVKLPEQFRSIFAQRVQLSEDIGAQLATWGAGAATAELVSAAELLERYGACSDPATLQRLEAARGAAWPSLSTDDKKRVKAASKEAADRIEAAARAPESKADDPDADLDAGGRPDRGAAGDEDRAADADAEGGEAA